MKKMKLVAITGFPAWIWSSTTPSLFLAVAMFMAALAEEWKKETDGKYWYQNDDGSYPAARW